MKTAFLLSASVALLFAAAPARADDTPPASGTVGVINNFNDPNKPPKDTSMVAGFKPALVEKLQRAGGTGGTKTTTGPTAGIPTGSDGGTKTTTGPTAGLPTASEGGTQTPTGTTTGAPRTDGDTQTGGIGTIGGVGKIGTDGPK